MAGAMGPKSKRKNKSGRRFLRLWANVKQSEAYHGLSVYARAALFELLDRYVGINNGMIGLGCRELAGSLNCSQGTACKVFRELDDSGLAQPTTLGAWRGKRATEWRLTFYRCDKTGELPVLNWPPRKFTTESGKVHVGKRKAHVSSSGEAHTPKNPISKTLLSSRGEAHIDIYQAVSEADTRTDAPTSDGLPENPSASKGGSNNFGPSETGETDPRLAALSNWGVAAKRIRCTKEAL